MYNLHSSRFYIVGLLNSSRASCTPRAYANFKYRLSPKKIAQIFERDKSSKKIREREIIYPVRIRQVGTPENSPTSEKNDRESTKNMLSLWSKINWANISQGLMVSQTYRFSYYYVGYNYKWPILATVFCSNTRCIQTTNIFTTYMSSIGHLTKIKPEKILKAVNLKNFTSKNYYFLRTYWIDKGRKGLIQCPPNTGCPTKGQYFTVM